MIGIWCRKMPLLLLMAALLTVLPVSVVSAKEFFVLSGRIMDIDGKPVAGAEVFVYDSAMVRRPADFISARTGVNGEYRLVLPRQKLWVAARVRSSDKFGPLLPGDRHSGEPEILEPDGAGEQKQDFTVVDIREAVRQKPKIRTEFRFISGRVVDQNGKPVRNAYVYALSDRTVRGVPEYVSAWTGDGGEYSLYLPPGRYFLGAGENFPPMAGTAVTRELILESDKKALVEDVILAPRLPANDP